MDSRTTNCFVFLLVILMTHGNCAQAAVNGTQGQQHSNVPGANATNVGGNVTPSPGGNSPTNAPAGTAKPVKHCITGQCVAAGNDESCLGKLTKTCLFTSSCTKTITKNQTHYVFQLDCDQAACPKVASTTVKPPTPAAATTTITSTCCTDDLCNKFQPKSAGVRFSTNVLYLGGILLLVVLM